MPRYIKAEDGPKKSVSYTDATGTRYLYAEGTRTWRNNNPGNLVPGEISRRNGQIGVAGGFAVFPDVESGRRALIDSLKNRHGNKSLAAMIRVYAPKHENNTKRYLAFVRRRTGVRDDRKIKDFSPDQFDMLRQAIEDMEGWKSGQVTEMPADKKRITRVRKNKKRTITAYFVESLGWISKSKAIALAQEGEIDAVVATSRNGNLFLKTRPDKDETNNLKNLG